MNAFQHNLAETDERTLSERHIRNVQEQGGVFVEAVRLTRMPMLVTDATLPGNPIIFANRAFVELSGYAEDELLGQDPHFMNGEQTEAAAIRQYETPIRDLTISQGRETVPGNAVRQSAGQWPRVCHQPLFSPTSTSRGVTMPKPTSGSSLPSWRGE